MNILVIAHYQNDSSPSAIFVHDQIKAYLSLGHTVHVLTPIAIGKCGWNGSRFSPIIHIEVIDGIHYTFLRYLTLSRYGEKHFNTVSAIGALSRHFKTALNGFKPDVIHAHTLGFDSEIGAWLKERLHVPLVVTTHGSDTSIPVEQGRTGELKPFCDKADRVIAVSSALANKLRSCGTQTPISVVLNGYQSRLMPVELTGKTPISLIQVGHLQEQKRVHVTIRAFAALRKRHPEVTLTIIGQGEERNRLEMLCRELGVENAVCFLGQVPNEAVMAEMAKSQFFVMPSVNEGFGIVYLEAMASGCITIGTEGEGIADLIVSGENGFLVPPDDPDAIAQVIEACIADPKSAASIAETGCSSVRELTWEDNARRYLSLFYSLTDRN